MWHLSLTLLCLDGDKELLVFANGHHICWKVSSPFHICFFPWLFSSFSVTGKGASCYFTCMLEVPFYTEAFWNTVKARYCNLSKPALLSSADRIMSYPLIHGSFSITDLKTRQQGRATHPGYNHPLSNGGWWVTGTGCWLWMPHPLCSS